MDELIKTSPFGYRVSPITGYAGELHTGQDYGAPCGTPVAAAAGGTVVEAGFQVGGGGNRIVVDHGNGLETTYNHLSTIDRRWAPPWPVARFWARAAPPERQPAAICTSKSWSTASWWTPPAGSD